MENKKNFMNGIKVGYAMTGSFCTFEESFSAAELLIGFGAELIPIMSENAAKLDTRFGKAEKNIERLETLTGKKVIKTIADAEPIGPSKMCDIMIVSPCTGNTMAKLANSITDTSVTMAVKSHVRNGRPVLICPATNDALGGSSKNIGILLVSKHYYFVPFRQDDPQKKPNSAIGDFTLIPEAIKSALKNSQLQPILI
ncbi:MAG: dipicolinate synthase subunit B [Eubacterium sp.]|jgi:dipicolinate synthase subunit B|nr:dipicolinate synthase subunit B [Eubacterium sp.]